VRLTYVLKITQAASVLVFGSIFAFKWVLFSVIFLFIQHFLFDCAVLVFFAVYFNAS